MKKNTKVKWTTLSGDHGKGTVLSDEEDGRVLVMVESWNNGVALEVHPVICCTVTWLTVEALG